MRMMMMSRVYQLPPATIRSEGHIGDDLSATNHQSIQFLHKFSVMVLWQYGP